MPLPAHLRLQLLLAPAFLLVAASLLLTTPSLLVDNPLTRLVSRWTGLPVGVGGVGEASGTGAGSAVDALAAYLACGIAVSYGVSLWTGDKVFVYNVVPTRLILALLGLGIVFLAGRGGAALLTLVLGELASALVLGWSLGSWTGVPSSQKEEKGEKGRE